MSSSTKTRGGGRKAKNVFFSFFLVGNLGSVAEGGKNKSCSHLSGSPSLRMDYLLRKIETVYLHLRDTNVRRTKMENNVAT